MSVLTIPVQLKTPPSAGLTPTSLLQGEPALDHYLGRLWWADNNGNKQFASLPAIATAAQQDDVRQLMIQMAKLQGKVTGYASGFADDYADQSGVDAASSTGQIYDATNKLFTNLGAETTQSLPAMTSNNAPSGHVASASSVYSSAYDVFQAFDQSTAAGSNWSANGGVPQWVQRQTPAAITLAAYAITSRTDNNALDYPTAWTFLGSNDGSTWTTLDTQSGQAWTAKGQTLTFPIAASVRGSYKYHRLNITGYSGSQPIIAELALLQQILSALDLRSVAAPASIVPSKAGIFVLVKALNGGTITPNTNLIASVSRTGSASPPTWTQVNLVSAGAVGGFNAYEANLVDISAQASTSSMRTRIQTANGLAIQAQADVMQWAA